MRGGVGFDRGHIYQLLTNPIYAGRIRHRDLVFEGQHEAIIDPARWDALQAQLQGTASRIRFRKNARRTSHLCGKLFDETGDRLTPSHSRTKTGTRLRYYISHRLVARSGETHPGAWRLPADQLEAQVAALIRRHLADPTLAARLCEDADAGEIARIAGELSGLSSAPDTRRLLSLIARVDIALGEIGVRLAREPLAEALSLDPETIASKALLITAPFQQRKRGVETKIILADAPSTRDDTLIRNIALAHRWLERIKAGETFGDIATSGHTSKRRVQHMIDLAFLAPDIVRDVLDGKQPLGFTSDWCKTRTLPSDWQDQRDLLATL